MGSSSAPYFGICCEHAVETERERQAQQLRDFLVVAYTERDRLNTRISVLDAKLQSGGGVCCPHCSHQFRDGPASRVLPSYVKPIRSTRVLELHFDSEESMRDFINLNRLDQDSNGLDVMPEIAQLSAPASTNQGGASSSRNVLLKGTLANELAARDAETNENQRPTTWQRSTQRPPLLGHAHGDAKNAPKRERSDESEKSLKRPRNEKSPHEKPKKRNSNDNSESADSQKRQRPEKRIGDTSPDCRRPSSTFHRTSSSHRSPSPRNGGDGQRRRHDHGGGRLPSAELHRSRESRPPDSSSSSSNCNRREEGRERTERERQQQQQPSRRRSPSKPTARDSNQNRSPERSAPRPRSRTSPPLRAAPNQRQPPGSSSRATRLSPRKSHVQPLKRPTARSPLKNNSNNSGR